ncbi:MAG: hypothetical protein ACI87O_000963 [Planctomycetota bacterium]|jgi:hypothetical protein
MEPDRNRMTHDPTIHFVGKVICWVNRSLCVLAILMIPGVLLAPSIIVWAYSVWQYTAFVLIMYLLVFSKNEALYKSGKHTPPWL